MEPNLYGLIRNPNLNLIALPFVYLYHLEEYEIELIDVNTSSRVLNSYSGAYYSAAGTRGSYASSNCYDIDIDGFEYVLLPVSRMNLNTTVYSGTTDDITSSPITFNKRVGLAYDGSLYAAIPVDTSIAAAVSLAVDNDLPILGFRRHRSDHVNPLGIIQPINPGILQPGSLQPAVEDPDVQEES